MTARLQQGLQRCITVNNLAGRRGALVAAASHGIGMTPPVGGDMMTRLSKTLLIALLGSAALVPGTASAQDAAPAQDGAQDGAHGAQPIVVTANRAPVRLDQVGQSMTVLTESAIAASQAVGVTELLVQTPGVQFARNGGPGTASSVYIRGAEAGQTVILYDGVRLHDPSTTDGGASLTDTVTTDIGRIEVLRGAQSTLYGSQAIGGVINIITRVPTRPFEARMQAEGGSLDTYMARASIGGRDGGLTWRLGGSYSTSDGVSAFATGTERDGYENTTLSGRLGYAFSDAVSIDLRSAYAFGDVEFDTFNGDALNSGETETWLNYAGLNVTLAEVLQNRIAYSRTDITRINFDESAARAAQPVTFDAAGKTDRFEYQGTLAIAPGYFAVFGVDHAKNTMHTASPSLANANPPALRGEDSTTGLYAQLNGEVLPGLSLAGGLRIEDHSTFGSHTVGSLSAAWSLFEGNTVLRASWAEGFKAPGLYQLYSQYGNTGLAPEEATSWDLGIEQRLGGVVTLSAVYFNRDTTNLITFANCSGAASAPLCADGRFGYYDNVGRVEADGVELGASLLLHGFSVSANYTYLDAVNDTAGDVNRGKQLARRPKNTVNGTLAYSWPFGLETAASVRIVGKGFNNVSNSQVLEGYTTVDLRLSLPVTDTIEVYGRVENLFDETYQTILDYSAMPRLFTAGARLKF